LLSAPFAMNAIHAHWQQIYAGSARLLLAAPASQDPPAKAERICDGKPRASEPPAHSTPKTTGPLPPPFGTLVPGFSAGLRLASSVPEVTRTRKVGVPGWVTALFVVMAVLLGVGGWIRGFASGPAAKVASTRSSAVQPPATVISLAATDPPHPFARFIEVTGLRVVVDLNHRSQVQYLVVNHSELPLADIALTVAVRSALAASGSEPLFTVSTRVPSLGAHQSKEIRTDLDSDLRSAALPDWDNLRTEVHVTSPP
jgi:hypothetical protein